MGNRATMDNVASLARVSIATVSAVVNDTKYVSPELKQRVQRAVELLDYKPNMIARNLRMNETKSIGLVFFNIASPFWAPLARTVQKVARELGYDTLLASTDEDPEVERAALHNLLAKQVDGILIAPTLAGDYGHIHKAALSTPVVAVEREVPGVESVITNNEDIMHQAVSHLVEHGYRRIGLVTIPVAATSTAHRIYGYKRALAEKGLFDQGLVREVDFAGDAALDAALDLLEGTDVRAVVTTSQSTAMGVLRAANRL